MGLSGGADPTTGRKVNAMSRMLGKVGRLLAAATTTAAVALAPAASAASTTYRITDLGTLGGVPVRPPTSTIAGRWSVRQVWPDPGDGPGYSRVHLPPPPYGRPWYAWRQQQSGMGDQQPGRCGWTVRDGERPHPRCPVAERQNRRPGHAARWDGQLRSGHQR